MLNFGPFKPFLLIFYIGNNKNPSITDEICWSLDFRYCEVQLYTVHKHDPCVRIVTNLNLTIRGVHGQRVTIDVVLVLHTYFTYLNVLFTHRCVLRKRATIDTRKTG